MQQEPSGNLLGIEQAVWMRIRHFIKEGTNGRIMEEKKKQLFLPFVVLLYKRTSKSLNRNVATLWYVCGG